ncbi:MAG TPA: hypothetical protein VL966_20015 [Alphaproteobacteria bacterium]|jgi:hypothetical protein|nr:hypothetical protein [Alphaproteobacteria bacterium]
MTHDAMRDDGSHERDDADHRRTVGQMARDTGEDIADTARDRFGDVIDPLRDKMRKMADRQKDAGAGQMEHIAKAVHGAADDLEHDLPTAAGYIHQAADRLERASAQMRDGDVDDLMHACGDFARRRPGAFFGGAVLAGFALARFLKSSPPSHEHVRRT